jgi:ABC-type lipoprotein release transport system permease subunit
MSSSPLPLPIPLPLRMAWRNLWRHKRRTWITVGAMVFSNLLLVFLISLQFGSYGMMIENTLSSYTGHLQIQHEDFEDKPRLRNSISDIRTYAANIRQRLSSDGITDTDVAARGLAFALVSSEQRSYGLQLIGVEPEYEPEVSTLPGLVASGRYLQQTDAAEIFIGSVLARNLKVDVGDELTLLGSGRDGSFAAGVVTIVGIFDSGMADIDRNLAQLPLGYFQSLFSMQGHGHSITVTAGNLGEVDSMKRWLTALLPDDQPPGTQSLAVLDWEQMEPGLKQAIQADMASAWFMYGILIILVAFSVMNTQLMSVLERTREFGIMLALGVKPRRLGMMVMSETALMATLGFAIGILLGSIVTWYISIHGFTYPGMEEMAERFNLPDRMYPEISLLSIVLGPAVIFIASLLSAFYPALRLFILQPVEAMRAV